MAAQVFGGRMAAALERDERRHVAGGTAARGSRRGGTVSALAAPPSAHASRPDLPVGGMRPRRGGFRNVDEVGHAIYRQLVLGARLEDYSADHPASDQRSRSALERQQRLSAAKIGVSVH